MQGLETLPGASWAILKGSHWGGVREDSGQAG